MGVAEKSDGNGREGCVGFGEEENVVTKLALKHGTVLEADEYKTFDPLIIFLYKKEKKQLKALRGILKAKVKCAVNKVNCVRKKIDIRNLTELNNTMYAVTANVTE